MARAWVQAALETLLYLALFTTHVLAQPVPSVPPVIPLCDAFKDLRAYEGKTVALRGQLYSSSEISALGAHCDHHFVTKYTLSGGFSVLPEPQLDYVWPDALNLGWGNDTNADAVNHIYEEVRSERAKHGSRALDTLVTVVGKLALKDRYIIGRTPDGKPTGMGYGHLSIYPGQIVIKTMLDPVIIEKTDQAK
jgi:hypothetical protein